VLKVFINSFVGKKRVILINLRSVYCVMAIKPICDMCKQELTDFGGILFSPPQGHDVKKYHLCKSCYAKIVEKF